MRFLFFSLPLACVPAAQTNWTFCIISQASLLHVREISHSVQQLRICRIFFRPLTRPPRTFSPNVTLYFSRPKWPTDLTPSASQPLPTYFICFFFFYFLLACLGNTKEESSFFLEWSIWAFDFIPSESHCHQISLLSYITWLSLYSIFIFNELILVK